MDFSRIYKKIGIDNLLFVTLCSVLLLQCFIWFNMILFLICIVILTFIRKYKIACFILIAIVYAISFRLELLDFLEKRKEKEREKREAEEMKRNNNRKVDNKKNNNRVNEIVNVKETETIMKVNQSPASDNSIEYVQCKVNNESQKESGGVQIIDNLPIILDKRPIADRIGIMIHNQWENMMKSNIEQEIVEPEDLVEEAGKGELPDNNKDRDEILSEESSTESLSNTILVDEFVPKTTYRIAVNVEATDVSKISDINGNEIGYVSNVAAV